MKRLIRDQILVAGVYISNSANTLGEGLHPAILPPVMGKKLGILGYLRQPVPEKENSEFKLIKFCLKKLTLCHILPVMEGLGKHMILLKIDLVSHSVYDGGVG